MAAPANHPPRPREKEGAAAAPAPAQKGVSRRDLASLAVEQSTDTDSVWGLGEDHTFGDDLPVNTPHHDEQEHLYVQSSTTSRTNHLGISVRNVGKPRIKYKRNCLLNLTALLIKARHLPNHFFSCLISHERPRTTGTPRR